MTQHMATRRTERVFEVTLNRPDKLNAISDGMLAGLKQAVREFAKRATQA